MKKVVVHERDLSVNTVIKLMLLTPFALMLWRTRREGLSMALAHRDNPDLFLQVAFGLYLAMWLCMDVMAAQVAWLPVVYVDLWSVLPSQRQRLLAAAMFLLSALISDGFSRLETAIHRTPLGEAVTMSQILDLQRLQKWSSLEHKEATLCLSQF